MSEPHEDVVRDGGDRVRRVVDSVRYAYVFLAVLALSRAIVYAPTDGGPTLERIPAAIEMISGVVPLPLWWAGWVVATGCCIAGIWTPRTWKIAPLILMSIAWLVAYLAPFVINRIPVVLDAVGGARLAESIPWLAVYIFAVGIIFTGNRLAVIALENAADAERLQQEIAKTRNDLGGAQDVGGQ